MRNRPIEILMAEDNEDERMLLEEALNGLSVPYNFNYAKDGVEALQYLRKQGPFQNALAPDIMLLDLNMPRKNGMEVLREIKEDDKLKTLPVIMLTTSNSPDDIMNSYKNFANCYITKPTSYVELKEVVDLIQALWFKMAKLPSLVN